MFRYTQVFQRLAWGILGLPVLVYVFLIFSQIKFKSSLTLGKHVLPKYACSKNALFVSTAGVQKTRLPKKMHKARVRNNTYTRQRCQGVKKYSLVRHRYQRRKENTLLI